MSGFTFETGIDKLSVAVFCFQLINMHVACHLSLPSVLALKLPCWKVWLSSALSLLLRYSRSLFYSLLVIILGSNNHYISKYEIPPVMFLLLITTSLNFVHNVHPQVLSSFAVSSPQQFPLWDATAWVHITLFRQQFCIPAVTTWDPYEK